MKTSALLATMAALAAAPVLAQAQQPNAGQASPQPQMTAPPGTVGAGGTGSATGGSTTGNAMSSSRAEELSTQEFMRMAAMSDRFEIDSSHIAMERSQNQEVKQFAQRMVQAHERTTQQLQQLMQQMQGGTGTQTSGIGTDDTATTRAGSSTGTVGSSSGGSGAASGSTTTAQGGMPPQGMDQQHAQMLQQLRDAQGAEFDRLYLQQQVQAHQKAVDMFGNYVRRGNNAQLKQWATRTLPTLQDHLQQAQQLQEALRS